MRGAEAPEPGVASTGRRMLTQDVGRCEGLGARARADYLPERRGHGARKSWRAPTWRRVVLAFSPPLPKILLTAPLRSSYGERFWVGRNGPSSMSLWELPRFPLKGVKSSTKSRYARALA